MPLFGTVSNPRHHEHTIYYELDVGFRQCAGCKEMVFGRGFVCPVDDCRDFVLHDQCSVEFEKKIVARHLDGLFVLVPNGTGTICFACGTPVNGYGYSSTNRDHDNQVMLHPPCAKLPYYVRACPEGPVLRLNEKMKSKCSWCKEERRPDTKSNWGYEEGSKKGMHIHVSCLREMFVSRLQTGCSDDRLIMDCSNGDCLDIEPTQDEEEIVTGSKETKLISSIKDRFCKIFRWKRDQGSESEKMGLIRLKRKSKYLNIFKCFVC